VAVFFAVGLLHFDKSPFVQVVEVLAVISHIVIFTNPSVFRADDYGQLRYFLFNLLLLACVWSEIGFGHHLK
jgi:hypothetical protein